LHGKDRLQFIIGQTIFKCGAEGLAAFFGEQIFTQGTVAQLQDIPPVGLEGLLNAVGIGTAQAALVWDARAIQVLTVVIDDPSDIAELTFSDIGHGLHQRTFAQLRVADDAPEVLRQIGRPTMVYRVAEGERQVSGVDWWNANRAGRQGAPRIRIAIGVIGLEHSLAVAGEITQAAHDVGAFLLIEPTAIGVAQETFGAVEGVIERGEVRLGTVEVGALARDQVQCGGQMQRRSARSRVSTNLRIAMRLLFAIVGIPDHAHGPRQRAFGDQVQGSDVFLRKRGGCWVLLGHKGGGRRIAEPTV